MSAAPAASSSSLSRPEGSVQSLRTNGDQGGSRRYVLMGLVIAAMSGLVIAALGGGAQVRSYTQLGVFLLLLIPVSRLSFGQIRVPRAVWLVAACAALSGFALRHVALGISDHAFVIGQLEEDSLQADAKILRDRMRASADDRSLLSIGTLSRRIPSREPAEKLIQSDASIDGVVWGSTRWLNVSLRVPASFSLADLPSTSAARSLLAARGIPNLKVVIGVPWVGISLARLPATGEYLGRLADVWEGFPAGLRQNDVEGTLELKLRALAALRAPWTSNAHRALPMWMTGTYHLVRAVSGATLETGELACAARSFAAARAQLRPGDNPELEVALSNNEAIVKLLRGGTEVPMKQAKNEARAALSVITGSPRRKLLRKSFPEGIDTVLYNHAVLRGKDGKRTSSQAY